MIIDNSEKLCRKCDTIKPRLTGFGKRSSASDGLQTYCKDCCNQTGKLIRLRFATKPKKKAEVKKWTKHHFDRLTYRRLNRPRTNELQKARLDKIREAHIDGTLTAATSKVCRSCHTEKPASDFTPNKSRRDGLQNFCRDCFNLKARQHRARQKEIKRQTEKSGFAFDKRRKR